MCVHLWFTWFRSILSEYEPWWTATLHPCPSQYTNGFSDQPRSSEHTQQPPTISLISNTFQHNQTVPIKSEFMSIHWVLSNKFAAYKAIEDELNAHVQTHWLVHYGTGTESLPGTFGSVLHPARVDFLFQTLESSARAELLMANLSHAYIWIEILEIFIRRRFRNRRRTSN